MELPQDLKLIIFDFDGTLHTINMDWAKAGRVIGADKAGETLGKTIERHKAGRNDVELNKLSQLEAEALQNDQLKPGTIKDLKELSKKYKIAILTRNSSKVIRDFLKRSGAKVDTVVGREDVSKLKPNPEGVNKILNKLSISPQQTLMVGDTWHDLLVANAAKVECVIVGNNYSHSEEPKNKISTVDELVELLKAS